MKKYHDITRKVFIITVILAISIVILDGIVKVV